MADTEIAVVSDTHVPSRASGIPDWVRDRIRAADHAIHAGDFDSEDAYAEIADLAGEDFTAVAGNTDPPSLGLPEVAAVEVDGVGFAVTHGTGSRSGYRERVLRAATEAVDDPDVVVSGHTHEVTDEEVDGVRLLNPGSATGAAPAERATMLTVAVGEDRLRVEVHEG